MNIECALLIRTACQGVTHVSTSHHSAPSLETSPGSYVLMVHTCLTNSCCFEFLFPITRHFHDPILFRFPQTGHKISTAHIHDQVDANANSSSHKPTLPPLHIWTDFMGRNTLPLSFVQMDFRQPTTIVSPRLNQCDKVTVVESGTHNFRPSSNRLPVLSSERHPTRIAHKLLEY